MGQLSKISTPPFLLTYWNPFDKEAPGIGQSFLNYVKDTSLAEYGAKIVGTYIDEANQQQIEIIESLADRVDSITDTLESEFRFLDQRMSRIEQEIINSNILLENISELLKLPDSEKKRQRHIELGLKFSNQSLKDSDLSIDSKEEFESALKLMPQDWFVLQQLGILHLHSPKLQDLDKAKEYFLKAAKYSFVENSESAEKINWYYKKNLSQLRSNQIEEGVNDNDPPLTDFIQDCYLNAALCAYILTRFNEAAEISKKALNIGNNNAKPYFFHAKYSSRKGDIKSAVEATIKALEISPSLSDAILLERELNTLPEVLDAIKDTNKRIQSRYQLIKTKIEKLKTEVPELIPIPLDKKTISAAAFYILLEKRFIDNQVSKRFDFIYDEYTEEYSEVGEIDILFSTAAKIIVLKRLTYPHEIQEELNISYDRAEKIMAQIMAAGIVGTFDKNRSMHVLIESEDELDLLLIELGHQNILYSIKIKHLETDWALIEGELENIKAVDKRKTAKRYEDKVKTLTIQKGELLKLLEKKTKELKNQEGEVGYVNLFRLFRSKTKKEEELKPEQIKLENLNNEMLGIKEQINAIEQEIKKNS